MTACPENDGDDEPSLSATVHSFVLRNLLVVSTVDAMANDLLSSGTDRAIILGG